MKLKIHYGYTVLHNKCFYDDRWHEHVYGCHLHGEHYTRDLSKVTCKVGLKYKNIEFRGMRLV